MAEIARTCFIITDCSSFNPVASTPQAVNPYCMVLQTQGEPLDLPLPNRKASIYTSSHFYLDDYPNAPEPISDAPRPHTTINPAAAFETADEGYSGTPFRDFTRPSFLPDSDDGGMDPGQALRNDDLNPPRPPTLGGRLRESGIQAAETIIAGGAAGAAAATRSVAENQTFLFLICKTESNIYSQ